MNPKFETAAIAGLEHTLPSSWYSSPEIYRLEKERIFCREWICAGRAEEIADPGSHRVLENYENSPHVSTVDYDCACVKKPAGNPAPASRRCSPRSWLRGTP